MLETLSPILWIIEIILGLGLIIFLHELGHFLMAKKNKVRVEAFSLGFGPAIWKHKRGDTEYRISIIPLGGYVKMAGEGVGLGSGKEDELTSKTAWQRLQIFSAGALMNLIIAFPICIIAFLAGKFEVSPEVGVPGAPETYAGMKPGDVILEIGGMPVQSGDQYRIEMVRKPRGSSVPVKVLRDNKVIELTVIQSGSESHRIQPISTRLPAITPGSALDKAGVKSGDEILAVNGIPVYTAQQLLTTLRDLGGQEVRLLVRRPVSDPLSGDKFEVRLALPAKPTRRFVEEPELLEPVLAKIEKGFPAYEVLQEEDVIRVIDGMEEATWRRLRDAAPAWRRERFTEVERDGRKVYGIEVRSWQDVRDGVESSVGVPVRFEVERRGPKVEEGSALSAALMWFMSSGAGKSERDSFLLRPTYGPSGKGLVGMSNKSTKKIAVVPPGSVFADQGLQSEDLLISIDGLVGEVTVAKLLTTTFTDQKQSVKVEVQRKDGSKATLEIKPTVKNDCDFVALGITDKKGELAMAPALFIRKRGFGEAVKDGIQEPINIMKLTYQLLYKLVAREESPKGLAGPIGIFKVSYHTAELSAGNFIWLLALITVNLGVFNLLPIPILDGGHIVLLAIEKIRRKPPSEKFVALFQYAGLVFLLALIVFVTYNDLTR